VPVNPDWHTANPMPPHATFEERVAWHRERALACGCREPPPDIGVRLAEDAAAPEDGHPRGAWADP
jgi:hypothetical protein